MYLNELIKNVLLVYYTKFCSHRYYFVVFFNITIIKEGTYKG